MLKFRFLSFHFFLHFRVGLLAPLPLSHWIRPPTDFVKVNCDRAFESKKCLGCDCFIFWDWHEVPLACCYLMFLGDDVLSIKRNTIFHTLLIALRMGFKSLHVEIDCSKLFQRISCRPHFGIWIISAWYLLFAWFIYFLCFLFGS